VESFYIQDDWKVKPTFLLLGGLRWDFQQAYAAGGGTYLKLDKFWYNMQPRVGFSWDFTGTGRGKLFGNYAYFVETPIPLDVNVRAGGGDVQLAGSGTPKVEFVSATERINSPTPSPKAPTVTRAPSASRGTKAVVKSVKHDTPAPAQPTVRAEEPAPVEVRQAPPEPEPIPARAGRPEAPRPSTQREPPGGWKTPGQIIRNAPFPINP